MADETADRFRVDRSVWLLGTAAILLTGLAFVLLYNGRPVWGMLAVMAAFASAGVVVAHAWLPSLPKAEGAGPLGGVASVAAFTVVGWLVLAMYAGSLEHRAAAMSVGFMVSLASIAAGGFLGFIFGIPRSVAAVAETNPGPGIEGQSGSMYRANTNLEQISDWLTKILVGVGLIQLGSIGASLSALVREVASGINPAGPTKSDVALGAALLVVYSILGFVGGYVISRTMLMRLFRKAERIDLHAQLVAADAAVTDYLQGGSVTDEQVVSAVTAVPSWFRSILAARINLVTQSTTSSTADRAVRLDKLVRTVGP